MTTPEAYKNALDRAIRLMKERDTLKADLEQALSLLELHPFCGEDGCCGLFCSSCHAPDFDGHRPDCLWAQLLAKYGREVNLDSLEQDNDANALRRSLLHDINARLDSLKATITNIDIEWKALGKDFEAQWERVERIEKVLRYVIQSRHHEPTPDGEAHPSNKEASDV